MQVIAMILETDAPMPRTGQHIRRMNTFLSYQSDTDLLSLLESHGLALWLVTNFVEGMVSEEGISIKGWDLLEDLDNTVHDMYPHWAGFATA